MEQTEISGTDIGRVYRGQITEETCPASTLANNGQEAGTQQLLRLDARPLQLGRSRRII